jgi:ectoine hydroxylase-related dioxygenase (phytanoyl-CoA dioxygenase family)
MREWFWTRYMKTTRGMLGDDQRLSFARDGFCLLSKISPAAEVDIIRAELMSLFERKAGVKEGALTDLVAPDGAPGNSPQILNPSNYSAVLRKTQHRETCFAIAREILGPDAKIAFEQALFKPPGSGAPTPWHQDDAFTADADADVDQITIWMPLQDVDEQNACMRYIPGSQEWPILDHHSLGHDPRVQALECSLPKDAPPPVSVPLQAGDCVVHGSRTLHSSTANMSERPRLAYALAFDGPPRRRSGPHTFPWHVYQRTLSRRIYMRWLMSGGIFVQAWRKIRQGRFNDPRRFGYKTSRLLRKLFRGRGGGGASANEGPRHVQD